MTCIVAITDGQRTIMGADSAVSSTDNPELNVVATSKVWKQGEFLVGLSGTYRAGQIARWQMDWPEPPSDPGADLDQFMVREVVTTLRQTLLDAGFVQSTEPTRVAQFMIALRGRIFTLGGDYSCASLEHPWIAIGAGRHNAYGALHALSDLELPLEDKVRRALAAAQAHTNNVREPFHLISTGGA